AAALRGADGCVGPPHGQLAQGGSRRLPRDRVRLPAPLPPRGGDTTKRCPCSLIGLSGHRFLNSASQAARAIAANTTAATSSATGSGAGIREGLPAGPVAA